MELNFYTLCVIYLVYSFLGWVGETVVATAKGRRFTNRGVASGPFCFVYGTAGVLITIGLNDQRASLAALFFGSMIYATVVEWLTAKLLERIHHRRWWDYSGKKFNLDGYVCLQYSLLWGLLGMAAVRWGNDLLFRLCAHLPPLLFHAVVWVGMALAVLDQISAMVVVSRYANRHPRLEQLNRELGRGSERLRQKITASVEKRIQRAYPAAARPEPTTSAEKQLSLADLLWLFVIGAFLGDVVETIFCRITAGVWMSRSSLVWGPFSVVWGLALVMAAALAVTAYAASVTVKYRVYVYSDEITFRQYDYSQSTTPSITNLTISATSSLGSGSALYHMKYADGAVAYCIEPGVHSDDSGTYKEGPSASWYNLPASVQSGIALAMSLGYPSADYGTASGDRNSGAIINAEKWAATQAIIWELICEYRNAYTYDDWGYSPFYGCVDTSRYPTFELWYDEIAAAMQNATMIPSFAEYAPRWCDTIELKRNAAGSYTATVTDDNEVLSDYNFAANSGSGITFSRKGNALTITATAAAAKNLDTEKTYSATGSAYEIDPDRAVICWYDRTGRYQAMAGYTGVGRDPVKAYIKIKAVEEKGSITVRKVDATSAPLAGAELLLETSTDGQTWTEVGKITTDKTGIAKWSDLKIGVKYRITETKAPAGYTLLTEPLFTGVLDSNNRDITITACNNAGFVLPFTGGTGFTTYFLFAALALMAGVYFCKKSDFMKEKTK